MTRSLFALLLALPAAAQLQLFTFDGATERAVTPIVDLGATAMGDASEYRFHARNNTAAGIALQTIAIAGQAFSLSAKPALPYIVAPGNFAEFRVRFAPFDPGSYSATAAVNGSSILLRATATAAPVVSVESSGPASILAAGSAIDFGRILKNTSAVRQVRVANPNNVPLTVSAIALNGSAFHGPGGVTLPAQLRSGDAFTFTISFDPKAAGQQSGTMSMDGRTFALTGVAYEPPYPKPAVEITGAIASASQPTVAVKLAAVSGVSGTGTLTLDFHASPSGAPDDPGIMFLSSGSRKLSFKVAEGDDRATFGAQALKQVTMQTGTTAGDLVLTIQLGDYTEQTTLTIPPTPVSVDQATAVRRVSDIDVQMSAFDNTRTAGKFNFTFYDRGGRSIGSGPVKVDAAGDFSRYFAISRVGGAFLMRATFPVTGDATQVGAVEVELLNAIGAARTSRLNLP